MFLACIFSTYYKYLNINIDRLPKLGKSHNYNTIRGKDLAYKIITINWLLTLKNPLIYAGMQFYNPLPEEIIKLVKLQNKKNKTLFVSKTLIFWERALLFLTTKVF